MPFQLYHRFAATNSMVVNLPRKTRLASFCVFTEVRAAEIGTHGAFFSMAICIVTFSRLKLLLRAEGKRL